MANLRLVVPMVKIDEGVRVSEIDAEGSEGHAASPKSPS